MRRDDPRADLTVVLVDQRPVPVDEVGLGMLGEVTPYRGQRAGQEHVVGVSQPMISPLVCAKPRLIRVGLAAVGLGHACREPVAVAIKHGMRGVVGAAVLDDVLKRRVGLVNRDRIVRSTNSPWL